MDKDWKLQRYSRKDYSEVVDFPVEIVGRDGVVRRYSFEDSIRLYQRRITFAAIRYRDGELVRAEVHHCRSRVEQLRRSFFHRFGWGTPSEGPGGTVCFGEYAGEVTAFLRRQLHCPERPNVSVMALDGADGPRSTWFVQHGAGGPSMLLYFFHLDGPGAETLRERFFETLKLMERTVDPEADCEHLLGFHHTADCGMVLTARGGDLEAIEAIRGDATPDPVDPELQSPWDRVVQTLRAGRPEDAVAVCRELVTDQPYHRRAYLAGAALSLSVGDAWLAEDFALVGSRYFPDDGLMHHYLARARQSLGRVDEARVDAERACALAPDLAAARFHRVSTLLQSGQLSLAERVLSARAARGRELFAEVALDRLGQWVLWRRVMRFGAHASTALGLAATLFGGPVGLVPMGMGIAMATLGGRLFSRQLDLLVERYTDEDLAMALRRIHRSVPEANARMD